jgi:hypothetical protein
MSRNHRKLACNLFIWLNRHLSTSIVLKWLQMFWPQVRIKVKFIWFEVDFLMPRWKRTPRNWLTLKGQGSYTQSFSALLLLTLHSLIFWALEKTQDCFYSHWFSGLWRKLKSDIIHWQECLCSLAMLEKTASDWESYRQVSDRCK